MWMVVRTKPRAEKKVERLLNLLTMDGNDAAVLVADALIIKVKRKWSDRTKIVEVPSVSGYVFVRYATELNRADELKTLAKINYTPGVLRLLTLPGKSHLQPECIARISDRELQICHAAAQESGDSIAVSDDTAGQGDAPELTPGAEVRFRQGPLAALGATFTVEDISNDTPTLFINEGIFKNAHFNVSKEQIEIVK